MKNILFLLLALTIVLPNAVFAQKTTPTAAPSGNQVPESAEEIERVQRIKDIVASKVAELNLVEKKGILATVNKVSNTEIKATDNKDQSITIDVDELTNFDFDEDDFGISDLNTGSIYSFVGLYNKDSEKLLARFISQPDSIPNYIEGAISELFEDDFQISVVDELGNVTTVDIEKSTDTMILGDDGSLEKSGFSGFEVGQRIIVVGFSTGKNEAQASRIIHFANIPAAAKVLANLQAETTVATGSDNTLEILEAEEVEN